MLLQVTNDCSLLPLLVQVVEVKGGLIAILMQQDPSRQGICGSLLLAMLQESCRRMAQLIQGMLFFFFFFFIVGYREDVHSMQAARPTKIPDEPMLCETPALSR